MRAYAVRGPSAAGTANKTGVTVIGATVRPAIYEIQGGCDGTAPTDVEILYLAQRFTTAGTAGSAPVPEPLDPADTASVSTAGITHSAEPGYTAAKALAQFAGNIRSPWRWVVYQDGRELKAPAVAANGIGMYLATTQAATSIAVSFLAYFIE